jgi:hypothetical protein
LEQSKRTEEEEEQLVKDSRAGCRASNTGDRKGDANNKKAKKYELAAPPTRDGKKQRKQKGPEAAKAEGTRSSRSLARGSRLPPSASFGF